MSKAYFLMLLLAAPAAAQEPIDATMPYGVKFSPADNLPFDTASACDNFNRPNSSDLGLDWTEKTGDYRIESNETTCITAVAHSWMRHNSASRNYVNSHMSVDFGPLTRGQKLIYVALIAGVHNSKRNVFVKLQDNDSDGLYDRVYFYKGVNGGPWKQNNYYRDLQVPTESGRMSLSFANNGDTAVLDIDRDFDQVIDESFRCHGVRSFSNTLGTNFGIGTFNSPSFDNYDINDGGCGGGVIPLTTPDSCPGAMNFTATNNAPGDSVVLAYSIGTGSYTIPNGNPCQGLTLQLDSRTYTQIETTVADGAGVANFGPFNIPGKACGRIYLQAINLDTCTASTLLGI